MRLARPRSEDVYRVPYGLWPWASGLVDVSLRSSSRNIYTVQIVDWVRGCATVLAAPEGVLEGSIRRGNVPDALKEARPLGRTSKVLTNPCLTDNADVSYRRSAMYFTRLAPER